MAIRKVPVVPWAILSKSLVVSFRTGITLSGLPGKGKGPRLPQLQVPSMLSLFQRKRPPVTASLSSSGDMEKGLMRPESVAALLSTARRQKLLEHIWQRTSLSRKHFASLYLAPLQRYAELVQQFPVSEAHHHAYQGGMLDHGLEIVAYALKLRQSYLLPSGKAPVRLIRLLQLSKLTNYLYRAICWRNARIPESENPPQAYRNVMLGSGQCQPFAGTLYKISPSARRV